MQTLLIVEDEKLIRKGIAAMAARSSVHIGEIIESRNGEEALNILKSRRIDTVFMDIRMPKMDGLELIRHIDELEEKPDVVVLSGYDDFNYAVEMLKHGVFDYVLKPVKRETIETLLVNLEKKQQKNTIKMKKELQFLYHQIKLMLNDNMGVEEIEDIQKQYKDIYGDERYVIVCAPQGGDLSEAHFDGVLLENIKGQDILLMPETYFKTWRTQTSVHCFGASRFHSAFSELGTAYEEARQARIWAFMKCRDIVSEEDGAAADTTAGTDDRTAETAAGTSGPMTVQKLQSKESEQFVEQFVRQLSTKDRENVIKRLEALYFEARHCKRAPEDVLELTENIQKMIVETYQTLVPEDKKALLKYDTPLSCVNYDAFLPKLTVWLEQFVDCLSDEFIYDQNKRKVRAAVEYIRENYSRDLNMAQVSNYVGMNYSLFSLTFKEYTGVNFVNYLKNIRIGEAKRLLEETDWKISDIGHKVGYENDKHFMKIFKSICGVSPTDYRKNML